MKRYRTVLEAIYRLYAHSGFTMAGAVAFSFVVSLFPFCIFLGALAGIFGGRELAAEAVDAALPDPAAARRRGHRPAGGVHHGQHAHRPADGQRRPVAVLRHQRHRDAARRPQRRLPRDRDAALSAVSLFRSMLFVFVSAVSMLVLTWAVLVGPVIAHRFEPHLRSHSHSAQHLVRGHPALRLGRRRHRRSSSWRSTCGSRQASARIKDVWPGVLLSIVPLARAGQPLLLLPELQRLHALLCRPVAAHGGDDLLPDDAPSS